MQEANAAVALGDLCAQQHPSAPSHTHLCVPSSPLSLTPLLDSPFNQSVRAPTRAARDHVAASHATGVAARCTEPDPSTRDARRATSRRSIFFEVFVRT